MDCVGKGIKHKVFGLGKVISQDGGHIYVKFRSDKNLISFVYPSDNYENFFTFVDFTESEIKPGPVEKRRYMPEYVIMWGNRLWNNAPSEGYTALNIVRLDGYESGDGYYTLKDGTKVKAIAVHHPSAGYDWAWWNRYLKLWGCI